MSAEDEVRIEEITERTRSAIRNLLSFQAYSERKIVFCGYAFILSSRARRRIDGEKFFVVLAWKCKIWDWN